MTPVLDKESIDSAREQREDRLKWLILGVVVVLGITYILTDMPERKLDSFVGVIALTAITYGLMFYAKEKTHIRERWLWKAILATIPLHLVFLSSFLLWAWRFPHFAHMGLVFFFLLGAVAVVELALMNQIVNRFRPRSGAPNP